MAAVPGTTAGAADIIALVKFRTRGPSCVAS